jgi:hypothetical protein
MKRPRVPHRAQVLDKMQMNSNADLTPTSPLRVFPVEDWALVGALILSNHATPQYIARSIGARVGAGFGKESRNREVR